MVLGALIPERHSNWTLWVPQSYLKMTIVILCACILRGPHPTGPSGAAVFDEDSKTGHGIPCRHYLVGLVQPFKETGSKTDAKYMPLSHRH